MRGKVFLLALAVAIMLTLSVGTMSASASGPCSVHYVRYGETLSSIARYYGTSVSAIALHNNIYNPHYIQAGTYLCVPHGYGYGYSGYKPYYGHQYGYSGYKPYYGYRYSYSSYKPYYGYQYGYSGYRPYYGYQYSWYVDP